MKYRVGIIGYGLMGKTHAEMYGAHPAVETITVFDTNPVVFKTSQTGRINIEFREKLEGEERFDLVSICTPTYEHVTTFLAFAKRARAFLIEKPLALTLREAQLIQRVAGERGVKVCCAFVERFNPPIKKLKNEGCASCYEFVRIGSKPKGSWYCDDSKSGGPLLDLGIHDIDLARWLTESDVDTIEATQKGNIYAATLHLLNGVTVRIRTGWVDTPNHFENSIVASGVAVQELNARVLSERRYPDAYRDQIHAFIDSKINSRSDLASLEDAISSISVAERIKIILNKANNL